LTGNGDHVSQKRRAISLLPEHESKTTLKTPQEAKRYRRCGWGENPAERDCCRARLNVGPALVCRPEPGRTLPLRPVRESGHLCGLHHNAARGPIGPLRAIGRYRRPDQHQSQLGTDVAPPCQLQSALSPGALEFTKLNSLRHILDDLVHDRTPQRPEQTKVACHVDPHSPVPIPTLPSAPNPAKRTGSFPSPFARQPGRPPSPPSPAPETPACNCDAPMQLIGALNAQIICTLNSTLEGKKSNFVYPRDGKYADWDCLAFWNNRPCAEKRPPSKRTFAEADWQR